MLALAREAGLSTEEAGHRARFAAFRQAAQEVGANKLALGHHRDDRAETVLLHLLKGCALDGLAAMPPREGWLIRPVIDASKAELLAYCQNHQLPFYWDASNDEPIYLRNQIRLELLPHLQEAYNPNMVDALVRLAELAANDKQYLDQQAQAAYEACVTSRGGQLQLALAPWRALAPALAGRVLRKCFLQLRPQSQGLSYRHTEQLSQLAWSDRGAKRLALPEGVWAVKGYSRLIFTEAAPPNEAKAYERPWPLNEEVWLAEAGAWFYAEWFEEMPSFRQDFRQVVLDAEKLPEETLIIRSRRPGDRLRPLGMQGEKKLKAYFIDKKVPQALRDRLPLVFAGDTLLWVPGYTVAQGYQAGPGCKKFCRLTVNFALEAGILPEINETN